MPSNAHTMIKTAYSSIDNSRPTTPKQESGNLLSLPETMENSEFKKQLERFSLDREQLQKDILEFTNCKKADEQMRNIAQAELKAMQERMNKEFSDREIQIEFKEKQLKDFEADLRRRERQLTELILKNERSERGFNTSPSFLQSDVIDFNKSAERLSTKSANIDTLINQFQSH